MEDEELKKYDRTMQLKTNALLQGGKYRIEKVLDGERTPSSLNGFTRRMLETQYEPEKTPSFCNQLKKEG